MRLKERVALVSAMASGIGQAIAERFAAEGAAIIGVDVDEKGGISTRDENPLARRPHSIPPRRRRLTSRGSASSGSWSAGVRKN